MSCTVNLPSGIAECFKDIGTLKGVIITQTSKTWTDRTPAVSSSYYKTGIQESLDTFVLNSIEDYEVEAGETVTAQSPLTGAKTFLKKHPDSLTVFAHSIPCDWNDAIASLGGGTYRVIPFSEDGKIMMTKGALQTRLGFTAKVYAEPFSIPGKDDVNKAYKLSIAFQKADEFKEVDFIEPIWDLDDLAAFSPIGLEVNPVSALAGTSYHLIVNERCGDFYSGTLTAEIISSNVTSPSIVLAYNASTNGDYTATVQKGESPTDLSAGNWIKFRIVNKTGDVYNYVSGYEIAAVE